MWLLQQLQPLIARVARDMVSYGNPAETVSDHEQTLRMKVLGLLDRFQGSSRGDIDQTAMRLVYHYRLPQKEIARIVGETEQKVSRRLKRLWKELQSELGEKPESTD